MKEIIYIFFITFQSQADFFFLKLTGSATMIRCISDYNAKNNLTCIPALLTPGGILMRQEKKH